MLAGLSLDDIRCGVSQNMDLILADIYKSLQKVCIRPSLNAPIHSKCGGGSGHDVKSADRSI